MWKKHECQKRSSLFRPSSPVRKGRQPSPKEHEVLWGLPGTGSHKKEDAYPADLSSRGEVVLAWQEMGCKPLWKRRAPVKSLGREPIICWLHWTHLQGGQKSKLPKPLPGSSRPATNVLKSLNPASPEGMHLWANPERGKSNTQSIR